MVASILTSESVLDDEKHFRQYFIEPLNYFPFSFRSSPK